MIRQTGQYGTVYTTPVTYQYVYGVHVLVVDCHQHVPLTGVLVSWYSGTRLGVDLQSCTHWALHRRRRSALWTRGSPTHGLLKNLSSLTNSAAH